ncbi:hypothetical protein T02_14350 [Trichinella nativa]|uniref:Uncharacterized protein n=1 Tax=Trichinella nativa TaxID=6335 RepID=A0A0V1LD53_9BILA|nr:hypothetical protein T02_14350 [Trichinella nativa]
MDFFCEHSVITIIREHTCIRQPRVIIVCDIGYMWESVKSVIPIPSELNFEEYATIDDQLQVTHLMSNSEITNSIAKTNDDANNSRENNSDDEESPMLAFVCYADGEEFYTSSADFHSWLRFS